MEKKDDKENDDKEHDDKENDDEENDDKEKKKAKHKTPTSSFLFKKGKKGKVARKGFLSLSLHVISTFTFFPTFFLPSHIFPPALYSTFATHTF